MPIPKALVSSASVEWYTPRWLIDAALDVMGGIDLDPCSNSKESPNVPAATVYTKDDDGLSQEWRGRVWLNPPYGRGIERWMEKLHGEHGQGRIAEAIALVPASVETNWFAPFWRHAICFLKGRVWFIDGATGQPGPFGMPRAIAAIYLGANVERFREVFGQIGPVARAL